MTGQDEGGADRELPDVTLTMDETIDMVAKGGVDLAIEGYVYASGEVTFTKQDALEVTLTTTAGDIDVGTLRAGAWATSGCMPAMTSCTTRVWSRRRGQAA